ncbi:IRX4B protein, partial [Tichodroma muraria]|nr:IRX4B protein [Tichodroma muraria]
MSYPQFGYPYSSAPQFLMSTNSLTTCCESSSRTLAETGAAASAQTPVYCPVYESRLLATARHELNSAAALGVYGGPYAGPQGYGNYVTYGTEAPAFYSLVSRPGGCSLPPSRPSAPRSPPKDTFVLPPSGAARGAARAGQALSRRAAAVQRPLRVAPQGADAGRARRGGSAVCMPMRSPGARHSAPALCVWGGGRRARAGEREPPEEEEEEEEEAAAAERARSCLKTAAEECGPDPLGARQRGCESKMCFQQGQQLLEAKPRIWSLAHTATSLNQAEYPSCMLKRPGGSAAAAAPAPVSVIDRHQDSPVTNLRNWVDGVFHDPLFRHSTLNQALSNTTVSWATTKGAILETGALGRAVGNGANVLKGQLSNLAHHDSNKEFLAFPKSGSKMFCS